MRQNFQFRADSSAIGGTIEGNPSLTLNYDTSPATPETLASQAQTKPDNRVQDTQDMEEEGDVVGKLGGESEDFGAVLSSRGFDFQAEAPQRRATYSRGRAPAEERQRR